MLLTLDSVAGQQTSSAGWQHKLAIENVTTQLQEEVIASVFFLELTRVHHVELHTEVQLTVWNKLE